MSCPGCGDKNIECTMGGLWRWIDASWCSCVPQFFLKFCPFCGLHLFAPRDDLIVDAAGNRHFPSEPE
jgi:hypothetical protein